MSSKILIMVALALAVVVFVFYFFNNGTELAKDMTWILCAGLIALGLCHQRESR